VTVFAYRDRQSRTPGSARLKTRSQAENEGERCAETVFFDYRRQHHVAVKVARIFNTHGPRMHPNDGRDEVSYCVNPR
jgi:hypothetical protein